MRSEKIIASLVMALALVVIGLAFNKSFSGYLAQKAETEQKAMINEAIYQCGQISSASWSIRLDGTEIKEPYQPVYEQCLKDKEIEVQRPVVVEEATESGELNE